MSGADVQDHEAVSGSASARPGDASAPPVSAVPRFLGPAMAFDGGVATFSEKGRLFYTVPAQETCPFCDQELVYVSGKHDDRNNVAAILPDGSIVWCHKACRALLEKSPQPAMARHTKRPKCTRCGESWRNHCHATDENHGLCPDMIGFYSDEPVRNVA